MFKPTNEYFFSLVRQATLDEMGTSTDSCRSLESTSSSSTLSVPIAPHSALSPDDHPSLEPVAPFPYQTCEIDNSIDSLRVRVTTEWRDRTAVLPLPFQELSRFRRIRREQLRRLLEVKDKVSVGQPVENGVTHDASPLSTRTPANIILDD